MIYLPFLITAILHFGLTKFIKNKFKENNVNPLFTFLLLSPLSITIVYLTMLLLIYFCKNPEAIKIISEFFLNLENFPNLEKLPIQKIYQLINECIIPFFRILFSYSILYIYPVIFCKLPCQKEFKGRFYIWILVSIQFILFAFMWVFYVRSFTDTLFSYAKELNNDKDIQDIISVLRPLTKKDDFLRNTMLQKMDFLKSNLGIIASGLIWIVTLFIIPFTTKSQDSKTVTNQR